MIPALTFNDLLDIGIITFLVYRVLALLWGTIANKVLYIIVPLVAIYVISEFLGLQTTGLLLNRSWEVLLFVLLLVIQPELRQGLARLNFGDVLHRPQDDARGVVDEIVKAVSLLSAQRIGAIIAIENNIQLQQHAQRGVVVEARLRNELLRAIFFPDNPLHDGAVIIKEDRIEAAACFFPGLSTADVGFELGSRHRAGLGLSEETDALVIIVSEETGAITIAKEGVLHYQISSTDLLHELETWYDLPLTPVQERERTIKVVKK